MSSLFRNLIATLLVVLLSSHLVRSKGQSDSSSGPAQACVFDATKDLNSTAFYLEGNATRYRYPDPSGQLSLGGDDAELRIVCPTGSIVVGKRPTKITSSSIVCVGGPTVKLNGTFFYSPLNKIGCDATAEPIIQLTDRKAADGKKIVEIGYKVEKGEFLPVIDDLAVNNWAGGYIPRWAHFKALPVKATTPATSKATLKTSELTAKVNFDAAYDVNKQRNTFASLFNDTALVDKYLPADGTHSFVASQLVSQDDLYYENQRIAASYYETSVPVWKSVHLGNWKRVGEAIRQIASQSMSNNLHVWSGTYLSLWLRDSRNKTTYVNLPEGLKPAQFLFKYVHDAEVNRGIVFVTVNNPHLNVADQKNVICDEIPSCRTEYPEFVDFGQGYTYCCSLKSFEQQAKKLGLPIFDDAVQLFA